MLVIKWLSGKKKSISVVFDATVRQGSRLVVALDYINNPISAQLWAFFN